MNSTMHRNYYDDLDGNFLACKPENAAQGLEELCALGKPILGYVIFLIGTWCFYLVNIHRRFRKLRARQILADPPIPNVKNAHKVHPLSATTDFFSYIEKMLLSMGVIAVGLSFMLLVFGFGTMYPTTHIRGQVGDAVSALTFSAMWYNSLLAHQGAIYFKYSLPQPQGIVPKDNNSFSQVHVATLSNILDLMQSWLAPLIALLLWGLLRAGIYTRGWYMFVLISITCTYGTRTFFSIVFQRLSTLQRVASIVHANKNGTREEKNRRNGFVTSKTASIVLDLVVVLCSYVLLPGSFLFFETVFNSRQFAIHGVLNGTLHVLAFTVTCIHLHSKFKKLKRKKGKKTAATNGNSKVSPSDVSKGKSLPSGLSVVERSDV